LGIVVSRFQLRSRYVSIRVFVTNVTACDYRYVAALGAWITLLALAIDPFTQQIIRPVVCDRTLDDVFGKIPRANSLTEYDPKFPSNTKGLEISMLAAIYNGLDEIRGSIDV
jgi:hypothetical protein